MSDVERNERVVCVGVHILNIHGRPIDEIPPGQGGRLVSMWLIAEGITPHVDRHDLVSVA